MPGPDSGHEPLASRSLRLRAAREAFGFPLREARLPLSKGASPAAAASHRADGQGAGRALATTAKSAVLLLQPAPRR